jgi:DNA-binding CsgD family transcriptional regulator
MRSAARAGGLLERDPEIAALNRAIEGATGGAGRVVMIEGEPGIGKSRLVAAAAALAGHCRVLQSRGEELERDFAFGGVIQLFEPIVAGLGAAERRKVLAGAAGRAGPLLAGEDPGGELSEPALVHGLFWLATNLAEQTPLLLAVDDGHWVDPPSLRFLHYLGARVAELPIAVVVAARPAEPGSESALLRKLAALPATTILRPRALGVESIRTIVAESEALEPTEDVVRAIAETTGGNPLFVSEVLRAVAVEEPDEHVVARIREIGPDAVVQSLLATLQRLSPAATALAGAIAILGEVAELALAAELAGIDAREASECAGALTRAGVLRPAGPLGFAHPVLRSALYEDLRPAERAFGHATAARLLRDSSALPEQVAAQLIQAEPMREPWVVESLRTAAARASGRGVPASALRYLERALLEPGADRSATLLAELGRAEAAVGRDSAVSRFARAAELIEEPGAKATVLREAGRSYYASGRFEQALSAYDEALRALAGGREQELALGVRADRAAAALWVPGQGAAALAGLDGLLDAGRPPRTHAERVLLGHVAGAEFLRGDDRESVVRLSLRAWDDGALLRDGGPQEPLISTISGCLSASDELAASAEVVEATLAAARDSGSPMAFATASYLRGALSWFRGRVQDAVADAGAAVARGQDGWELFLGAAHWILAVGLLEREEPERAAAVLTLPAELEERLAASTAYCAVRQGRGLVYLARGEPLAAARELLAAGELVREALGTDNPAFLPWRSAAAVSLARLGDLAEARRLAEEELDQARRYGAARAIGVALRARALVEPDADRIELLRQAVDRLEGSGALLELARALTDLGGALRASGESTAARGPLRRALDMADGAGALATATRAREELLGAGGRPRRARTAGIAALTPGELRVARLAAEGRTNRQIAEDLFVTLKAVKWHLNNTYRKLEVDGRGELAAALAAGEVV